MNDARKRRIARDVCERRREAPGARDDLPRLEERLAETGIVDRDPWNGWNKSVAAALRAIDEKRADGRWQPGSEGLERALNEQLPLLEDVRGKIALLIGIITRLLGPDAPDAPRVPLPLLP